MSVLTFVVLALASFRLTRLVVKDDITEPLRARTSGWFGQLVTCPWCAGVYVSACVVYAATWFTSIPLPVAVAGACSALVGLISENLDG